MLRIVRRFTIVFLATLAALCLRSVVLNASEPDKPSGFSGYLLDASGLEKEQPASWAEPFESPGVSWRYIYQDGSINVLSHQRVADEAHADERSEFIEYEVEEPGVVVFGHYVDYPTVYDETAPSVWVRSDRPGVSLAALVVFPYTLRPDNKAPLTALILGSTYQKPGEWQKLVFPKGVEKLVEDASQAIRGEHKLPVDNKCAYIRQILLISEARYGEYSLWIDDLELKEHVRTSLDLLQKTENNAAFNPINLLSGRLKLSKTPIFWQDDPDRSVYGKEPFAIDEKKVEFNKNKNLNFSLDALSSLVSEKSLQYVPNSFGVSGAGLTNFGSTIDSTSESPQYAESAIFVPTPDSDVFQSYDEAFAQSSIEDRTIAATIDGKGSVGQINFVDDGKNDSITQNVLEPLKVESNPQADYLGFKPSESLVSGSGTLASPSLAAEYGFFHKGESLVPNAKIAKDKQNNLVDAEKIYSIRAVEYNGESLTFLKSLGFNAVWLDQGLTPEILQEANDAGMWLVAAPPMASENAIAPITGEFNPVLMWNVGARLRAESAQNAIALIQKVKDADQYKRPVVGSIYNGIGKYNTGAAKLDVVLLDREPMLSSLDLNDYGKWLKNYQVLFDVGSAAFWNKIQTQPNHSLVEQRRRFGVPDEAPGLVAYEQMRQCVRLSMQAGCRGLVFSSNSPLDAKDHVTQYRAKALEALNLEIQFLLTWFALGSAESQATPTSDPLLNALVLRVERASLVVPLSADADNQYVMGQDAAYNWETTIAVPESYTPDLLAPGALRKIVSKRKAGGCAFSLEEGSMNSLLFFTQSEALYQKMAEHANAFGRKMAELAIDLARKRIDMYEQTVYGLQYVETHGAVAKNAPQPPMLGPVVDKALALVDEAEQALKRRDVSFAYLAAERATREIRNAEKYFWKEATKTEIGRPVTPLSTSFYDMPAYLELYQKLVSGKIRPVSSNLIRGGDMETPQSLTSQGWQVYQEESQGLVSTVVCDAVSSRSGQNGLHVLVNSPNDQAPQEAECPVVCAETQFPVRPGQLICVQGWIKIPKDLTNSVDGVQIYSDQGGSALSLRFKKKCDWKRFAFYRIVADDVNAMRIRFAFSGVGDVYLDDLAAYVVQ